MQNPITKKSQQGFTLIELLIVVAIIGILAAIAIPQYAQYRTSAMNSAAESELKNVQTALEGYYSSGNYAYPAADSGSDIDFTSSDKVTIRYGEASVSGNQTYAACAFHQGGDSYYAINSSLSTIVEEDCGGDCGNTGCAFPSNTGSESLTAGSSEI